MKLPGQNGVLNSSPSRPILLQQMLQRQPIGNQERQYAPCRRVCDRHTQKKFEFLSLTHILYGARRQGTQERDSNLAAQREQTPVTDG